MSLKDAAAYLDCDYKSVQRRVADGSIPAVKFGKLIRVDLDVLDALGTVSPPVAQRPDAPVADPGPAYAAFIDKLLALTPEQIARLTAVVDAATAEAEGDEPA